jgi:hypothetical protein
MSKTSPNSVSCGARMNGPEVAQLAQLAIENVGRRVKEARGSQL